MVILEYIGDGSAWQTGVPTRDLTQADLDECGRSAAELVATGLYKEVTHGE